MWWVVARPPVFFHSRDEDLNFFPPQPPTPLLKYDHWEHFGRKFPALSPSKTRCFSFNTNQHDDDDPYSKRTDNSYSYKPALLPSLFSRLYYNNNKLFRTRQARSLLCCNVGYALWYYYCSCMTAYTEAAHMEKCCLSRVYRQLVNITILNIWLMWPRHVYFQIVAIACIKVNNTKWSLPCTVHFSTRKWTSKGAHTSDGLPYNPIQKLGTRLSLSLSEARQTFCYYCCLVCLYTSTVSVWCCLSALHLF